MPRTVRTTTAASPAPDPRLRAKVREALCALRDGRKIPIEMLRQLVDELLPEPADPHAIDDALNWNHDHQYVNFDRNEELERDEWFITSLGRTKQKQG